MEGYLGLSFWGALIIRSINRLGKCRSSFLEKVIYNIRYKGAESFPSNINSYDRFYKAGEATIFDLILKNANVYLFRQTGTFGRYFSFQFNGILFRPI